MTREEIIRLAKEAGNSAIDPLGLGGIDINWLERFAQLIAVEYKQDAERYRFLLDQSGNSDYAVCHWVDGDWFALGITKEVIDSEIDAAMEKVK